MTYKPIRTASYSKAVADAQDAIRLYYAECKQHDRFPLTWDTAEIAVRAAAEALMWPNDGDDQ